MTTTKRLLAIPGGAGSAKGRDRHFLESTGKLRQSSKFSRSDHDVSSMQKARIELTTCFHEFFTMRIYELFHQYFSVDKENKFPDGFFPLSFEHLRKSKNYFIIFGRKISTIRIRKFVKICRELDLGVETHQKGHRTWYPLSASKIVLTFQRH